MGKKIVIVGGVAGGATAAARLRRLDENSQIVIFERGEYVSFANCGLPYYVGGTIPDRDELLVQTVKGLTARYNLDIRVKSEVLKINRTEKTLEVENLLTGEKYLESYDYLILSPGANPIIPNIKGVKDADNVFTLRNIPDADAIKGYVENHQARNAVVVGGGFIGLEMAENLSDKGLKITIVEMFNQVMPPIDYEIACVLHSQLRDKGINLLFGEKMVEVADKGKKVIFESGKEIKTDVIVLSVGVQPENKLIVDAGLDVGARGGIKVNDYLQTADESIYAIGDAIEVKDYIAGSAVMIPLAWPANRQGRLVADNIYGKKRPYNGTMGTSVAKVFDMTVASTGLNIKTLKKLGKKFESVNIHPNCHAGYYPGAYPIALKLTFDPDNGEIFGAQAVGRKGVEKRIDVIATAIKGKLDVYDLQDLELAYAPPYSSGKDPVNLVGYTASNVVDGVMKVVHYDQIDDIVAQGNLLVDVSQPEEVEKGNIKGSVNIPLPQLRSRLNEIPKDKVVYVTCQIGLRGYIALRILEENGYNAINLTGGYKTYSAVFGCKNNADCQDKVKDTGEMSKG